MARLNDFLIYVLIVLAVSSFRFASAKPFARSSNDKRRTSVEYNLQKLADDTLVTTDVSLKQKKIHDGEYGDVVTDHVKLTDDKKAQNLPSSLSIQSERDTASINAGHNPVHHSRGFLDRSCWRSKLKTKFDSSKNVIDRESRDSKNSDGNDDEDRIQSKDEDDEDVQLIIIPRKPHKHLPTKVQDDDGEKSVTSTDEETEKAIGNSETSENSDDSENFRNDSEISDYPSRAGKSSRNGDVSLQERVDSENDDQSDQANEKDEDYDLHVKVKDKSGTNVKLTGDLPGNLDNLVAEGEGGARVQVKNSKTKDERKLALQEIKDSHDSSEASVDDVAQTLIKMKSGKLKHAPYPSTVLLKPSESSFSNQNTPANENNVGTIASAETSDVNEEISFLKSKGRDQFSNEEISKTVLVPPSQASSTEENANKQTNNVFSPMEFENGDQELVATSRLLDIAQQAEDESSLKELNDSSTTKSSSLNGITEKQRSTTSFKPHNLPPEDYAKQSDEIDRESNGNWYKLQSLQDRVVNEGSTGKTGKAMGSYNGQDVSVVSPSQLQLLQTEYPSYPAYLTALQRTKLKENDADEKV